MHRRQQPVLRRTVLSNYGPYRNEATEAEICADVELESFRRQCFAQRRRNHPSLMDGRQQKEAFAVPKSTLSYAHYVEMYHKKLDIARKSMQLHLRANREQLLSKIGQRGRSSRWASPRHLLNWTFPAVPDDTLLGTLTSFDTPVRELPQQPVSSSGSTLEENRDQSRRVAGIDSSSSVSLSGKKRQRPSQPTVGPGGTTSWEQWLHRLQGKELEKTLPTTQTVRKRTNRPKARQKYQQQPSRVDNRTNVKPYEGQDNARSNVSSRIESKAGDKSHSRSLVDVDGEPREASSTNVIVSQSDYFCPIVDNYAKVDSHSKLDKLNGACALCQNERCEGDQAKQILQFTSIRKSHQVHKACIEYSPEVYVNVRGQYVNAIKAIHRGRFLKCSVCNKRGATIGCRVEKCKRTYHFDCARSTGWDFKQENTQDFSGDYDPRAMFCEVHRI